MSSRLVLSAVIGLSLILIVPAASADHLPLVQQELNEQRQAWQATGAVDYDFRFQRSCFCVPDFTQPGLVNVRGGQVDSVEHPDTGVALDPENYLTVSDIYDAAQRALDSDAIEVRLEYDLALHYPTSLFIDHHRQIADDEISYLAGGLQLLSGRLSDLTEDGFVDFDDLTLLLANWNTTGTAAQGNIVETDHTLIDFDDLSFLLAEWTGRGRVPAAGDVLAAQGVPEPSSFALAMIGLLGLAFTGLRRRPPANDD